MKQRAILRSGIRNGDAVEPLEVQILVPPLSRSEIYFDGADMGSLAFGLLRQDHIVFGADRRHTRGDARANYKTDAGLKTMTILSGSGVLAFAGHDIGEQILIPAKNDGKLEGTSLEAVAREFGQWARVRYRECEPNFATMDRAPSVEFLLAGFGPASEGVTATAYRLYAPEFAQQIVQFPYRKFEVIGRSTHGALYALHRFNEQAQTIESGTALSAFLLSEIGECDTTIGGLPHLYIIRRGEKAAQLSNAKVSRLAKWAKTAGAEFGKVILKGPRSIKQ